VVREWRKLRNELNDLYSSPNIRVVKSRRMRRGRVVYGTMGRGEVHTGFCLGNFTKRDPLEDPGLDGRIILKLIFKT